MHFFEGNVHNRVSLRLQENKTNKKTKKTKNKFWQASHLQIPHPPGALDLSRPRKNKKNRHKVKK